MINYLHDIKNKLGIILGHTMILEKKYGENHADFVMIKNNVFHINQLINDAYREHQTKESHEITEVSVGTFLFQVVHQIDSIVVRNSIEILREKFDNNFDVDFNLQYNGHLIDQIFENAIDNSIKANATKIVFKLVHGANYLAIDIIDNGVGLVCEKELTESSSVVSMDNSLIPRGLGKKIMIQNIRRLNGNIEWAQRKRVKGTVVRLYFPKIKKSDLL